MNLDAFSQNLQRLETIKTQLETVLAQLFKGLIATRAPVPGDAQFNINNALAQLQRELKLLQKANQNVQQQLANLQGLVRTSALITSSLELDRVLEEVMDTIIALTGAERVYLMLMDSTTKQLSLRSARNWDQESLTENDVSVSRGVIDEALHKREPIVTFNAQEDVRFQARASVFANQLRSILCIPLILQDEVIGVLYADNRAQRGVFDDNTVPMMSAFANQAAIAIVNARRYQKIKSDLDEARQEMQRLRIQIDQQKLNQQVNEIADTDYFKFLEERATEMRKQFTDI
jgi:GAF domain-containing protein